MALLPEFMSRLIGTMQSYFKIGTFRINDGSGTAEAKNAGGTAYANLGSHSLELHGSNASNKITVTAPAGLGGNVTITLPSSAGTLGYALVTDGNGVTSWSPPVSNALQMQEEAFTEASSSPITIFAPADNSTIVEVQVEVTVAASAGSPTVSVGTAGDPDRDMDETDVDLKTVALYRVFPNTALGTDPDDIILTITPSSQTFTGVVRVFSGVIS
jgi:hypothetical protein